MISLRFRDGTETYKKTSMNPPFQEGKDRGVRVLLIFRHNFPAYRPFHQQPHQ